MRTLPVLGKKVLVSIGSLGIALGTLSGCAAGKFNSDSRTWQFPPQKDKITIYNFAVEHPPLHVGKETTSSLLQFAIINKVPNALVTLKSIVPEDGTGTVKLEGVRDIPGTRALHSPEAPPAEASDKPLGVKAILVDHRDKIRPGLTVPAIFNFQKRILGPTDDKNPIRVVSIRVNIPVKEKADIGHTFEQQNFSPNE